MAPFDPSAPMPSDTKLYYNTFDGNNWLDQDIKITKDGKTRTSNAPALAVYDGKLYMAYKGRHL